MAEDIGKEIALNNAVLLFGFEGDFDSLSTIAAKSAQEAKGKTIAFIWGNEKQDLKGLRSLQKITNQKRGGGREFVFILSCDGIISIGGGSGTLMEMAMAYQADIPTVALKNSGGWSKKLAGKFLDERKRLRIISAENATEAVKSVLKNINKRV
ncbi:MAG: hypothetical protein HYU48_02465 [Candidatus Levybacteria bacterium]|nr:hypothetical protein [Candidatus Levybacteria bacterium]